MSVCLLIRICNVYSVCSYGPSFYIVQPAFLFHPNCSTHMKRPPISNLYFGRPAGRLAGVVERERDRPDPTKTSRPKVGYLVGFKFQPYHLVWPTFSTTRPLHTLYIVKPKAPPLGIPSPSPFRSVPCKSSSVTASR